MLRFRLVASVVPLLIIGVIARGGPVAPSQPCLVAGDRAVQLATTPAQAQLRVGFTADPARADLRVQIVDTAEDADLAVIDDGSDDARGAGVCMGAHDTRRVAITPHPAGSDPLIYLTREGPAAYRIFVRSRHLTAEQAAALLIGASDSAASLTTAALDHRS